MQVLVSPHTQKQLLNFKLSGYETTRQLQQIGKHTTIYIMVIIIVAPKKGFPGMHKFVSLHVHINTVLHTFADMHSLPVSLKGPLFSTMPI